MTSNLNNKIKAKDSLRNRLIYGFSGFFLMMGGILWNEWSYCFVFLVICVVCLTEFYNLLIACGRQPLKWYGIFFGVFTYILSFLVMKGTIHLDYIFLLIPLFSLIFIIKLYNKRAKTPFENIALTLLGIIYIVLPFSALHIAVFEQESYSYQTILGVFFLIWMHDISAYFIGARYGKHKLFPRISPNKSWEGSFGGAILAISMAALLSVYLQDLTIRDWMGLAIIIVIAGTHGDLVESMLKRSLHVKDSSQALPGHGGFLDRFDGLLLSAPFIAVFLKIF